MPDAPFCSIDPWTRSLREATGFRQPGEDVRRLAEELRLLRHEIRAIRAKEGTLTETGPVRRPRMATLGHTEGGSHGK